MDDTVDVRFRRYRGPDADAVWRLHERALADAGTDPEDVPGTDDLRRIEAAYIDPGGEFLVGVLTGETDPTGGAGRPPGGDRGSRSGAGRPPGGDGRPPETDDGLLVAMGGFLPCEAGYDDERDVDHEDAAELHRMRVAPAYQRRGIGRRLLAALERRAAAAGFGRLLATTARRQAASVAFYAAEGYDEVGRSAHGDYALVHFEKRL